MPCVIRRAACVLALWAQACAFDAPISPQRPDAGPPQPPPSGIGGGIGAGGASGAASTSAGAGQAGSSGGPAVVKPPELDPTQIFANRCATASQESALLPSNLLFLVDRSGSMVCNPPPTTPSEVCEAEEQRATFDEASKWELTTSALYGALKLLPDTTAVGLTYFSNDALCGVAGLPNVPVARNTRGQQDTMAASLASIKPSGSTPLVGATLLAYQNLHKAALSGTMVGNRYVVLITDGQQSEQCTDPQFCASADACSELLVEQAAVASGEGVYIRTFVIGVPGSEHGRTMLSRIARAGRTAPADCNPDLGNCHFDVSNEADLGTALKAALRNIAGQTLTCELELPRSDAGAVDLARLNVVWTPHEDRARIIPQDDKRPCDSGADGWQYDANQQQIRLCGSICTSVRNDHGGRIDVVLGCPVIGPD